MSLLNNILNVFFASGYEIDKLFDEVFIGSFNVAAAASFPPSTGRVVTHTLPHQYGEDVLPVMQFSTDNSNWHEAGSMKFNQSSSLDSDFTATCYTQSGNIVIVGHNFTSSAQTCYYRILLVSDD